MRTLAVSKRVAIVVICLALILGVALAHGLAVSGTASGVASWTMSGPVNGLLLTGTNGGHVACPNNLPCGPDPVGTR
jgi:hypothetical protein